MISSSRLATILYNDLDQNAYTSRYDDAKIIEVINTAANYLCAYGKRPFTLVAEEHILAESAKEFTLDNEAFYPYFVNLDQQNKEITAVPIFPTFITPEGANKAHFSGGVVSFSES
jgi:hypothetical protein